MSPKRSGSRVKTGSPSSESKASEMFVECQTCQTTVPLLVTRPVDAAANFVTWRCQKCHRHVSVLHPALGRVPASGGLKALEHAEGT